jgi:hypothetical protein
MDTLHGDLHVNVHSFSKDEFLDVRLSEFWLQGTTEYPPLADESVSALRPFIITFICEADFSAMSAMKTKYRNRPRISSDTEMMSGNHRSSHRPTGWQNTGSANSLILVKMDFIGNKTIVNILNSLHLTPRVWLRVVRGVLWRVVNPTSNPTVEKQTLSCVRNCTLNAFAATFHIWMPSHPPTTWGRDTP